MANNKFKAKLFIILSSSAYSGDQQFIDRPNSVKGEGAGAKVVKIVGKHKFVCF